MGSDRHQIVEAGEYGIGPSSRKIDHLVTGHGQADARCHWIRHRAPDECGPIDASQRRGSSAGVVIESSIIGAGELRLANVEHDECDAIEIHSHVMLADTPQTPYEETRANEKNHGERHLRGEQQRTSAPRAASDLPTRALEPFV